MADDTEWTPKQDMSLLCRVCANQHDYLIPIFQGEGLDHDMPTKMDKHLPIKVRESDKLPTQMCYQCASTIIAWSELHTNCLAADKKLKGMLRINEKKMGVVDTADDDAGSDHYEDAYDDGGGGGDDDDEDFEKEIKQLISDAGVELGSKTAKASKRPSRAAATRKRKSEVTITPVKRETKKPKTEPSASKSSTALLKPKEEVVSNEDRFTCHQCLGTRGGGCRCKSLLYQCELCSFGFITNIHLIVHTIACQSKSDKFFDPHQTVYHCPVCKQILPSKETLRSHLTSHTDDNCLPCDQCDEKFNSLIDLEAHWEIEHPTNGEKQFVCETCGKAFATIPYLRTHKRTHTVESRRHICGTCGKGFLAPCHLKVHERIHTGEKPIVCELCGKNFADPSSLWIHRKLMHTEGEERPFKCEFCPKGFFKKSVWDLHMKSHLNVKPYACDICQKGFRTNHERNKHADEVHTTVRAFKCNTCNSDFKRQNHLNKHYRRVHHRNHNFSN